MNGTYDLQLVALSLIVAIIASYTALELAGRTSQKQGRSSWSWLAGGDEFVVVLKQIGSRSDATLVGNKMLDELSRPYFIAGHEVSISGRIGIGIYPADGSNLPGSPRQCWASVKKWQQFRARSRSFSAPRTVSFRAVHGRPRWDAAGRPS